jgi:ABC-2 type transport system ATP-binding protein
MKPQYAIETRQLAKSYPKVEALRGLDLRVPQGSLCGLVGVNGAGKTTTIRLLLGMATATAGEAKVLGLNALDSAQNTMIRMRTAYIPERKDLFPGLSVEETIRFVASFYPGWRKDLEEEYLKRFQLPPTHAVTQISKGTLTKLHLLLAIARGAELLVLDEPTDGLDAVASEETLQALTMLVADFGTTILICSHRLEEIEQVADHLCFIHKGRMLLDGPLDEIRHRTRRVQFGLDPSAEQVAQLSSMGILKRSGSACSLLVDRYSDELAEKLNGWGATGLEVSTVPLRELFVESVRREDALA